MNIRKINEDLDNMLEEPEKYTREAFIKDLKTDSKTIQLSISSLEDNENIDIQGPLITIKQALKNLVDNIKRAQETKIS